MHGLLAASSSYQPDDAQACRGAQYQVPRNTMCIVNLGQHLTQHSVKCHTKDSAGQHQLNYVCVGLVSLS